MTSEKHLENASGPELVEAWRNGDQLAAEAIFERYQSRLIQVVGNKLSHKLRSRLDPEDVLMSTMRSVFRMTAQKDMVFQDETGFWKWLLTITLNKTYNRIDYETRPIRTPDKESNDPSFEDPALDGLSPAAEAVLDDLLENILTRVNDDQKKILLAKLDGFTHSEIASHLSVSTKTIQRSRAAIRDAAAAVLGEEIPDQLKFAEIFNEILEEPVVNWLPDSSWGHDGASQTLGQVLHSPKADLQTLDGIRSVAKHRSNDSTDYIPKRVIVAIYLLAISAARVQHNINISRDSDEKLKKRVNDIAGDSWINGKSRKLLDEFTNLTSKC